MRECGEFLGHMKTLETQYCLCDAMELGNVLEAVSKKIREMTDTLKSEYIKQKRRDSKKNGSKDYSSSMYLKFVEEIGQKHQNGMSRTAKESVTDASSGSLQITSDISTC